MGVSGEYNNFLYSENANDDALSGKWLESRTSYIYKIGVMAAIDSNKCDFVSVVIASQRGKDSSISIIGELHFEGGENDDIARSLTRALDMLKDMHPVFSE